MKFLTFPAVLAAAVLSAVVMIPFIAGAKANKAGDLALEISMASNRAGFVQIYYADEAGMMSEETSSKAPLVQSSSPKIYRLALPIGRLSTLRFDPINRSGSVTIYSVSVTASGGRVIRRIPFSNIKPAQQISSLQEVNGRLEISTTPGGDDPQLTIDFTPPLEVPAPLLSTTARLVVAGLGVFVGIIGALFCMDNVTVIRTATKRLVRWCAVRPKRAVACAAALAVVASAYPVVFLGKSYVSPNLGLPLLYDDVPTLPGATDLISENPRGSDIGAMLLAHLPYSVVEHRALAGGEAPLWNRYNSAGTPLLGQGQSMVGDPLHLAVIAARGAAWAWDLKFLAAKWLFALCLGLLVLRITSHLPAALLVTIAAPFIGFFIYRINHPAYFSLCYAPWVLFCWVGMTDAASRRSRTGWATGLLAANIALMNSGTVKEAYMLLLAMNFSGACVLGSNGAPLMQRLAKYGVLLWTGVVFVLLTVPIWSTFLTTLRSSQTNYDLPAAFQIQPSLLLGAFDEAFFRLIMPDESVFNPALNFLLLLGVLYFVSTLRTQSTDRRVAALAISSLLPFALVFGLIPSAWIIALPLIGRVQHIDNSFLCALLILWSVLAGVGFARAATRLRTSAGRADLISVAVWLCGIIGLWIAFRQTVHRGAFGPGMTFSVLQLGQVLPVSGFVWAYLGSLVAASAMMLLLLQRALRRGEFTSATVLLLITCAAVLLWRNGMHAESVGFERYVLRPPARANLHAMSPAIEYVRDTQAQMPSRSYGLYHNFFPGWNGVCGLEGISGPDALMNPWYRELIALSGTTRGISWDFSLPTEHLAEVRPVFDALNVRHYFNRGIDDPVLRRSLKSAQVLDLDVWESETVWPRAFFTDRVMAYDDANELVAKIKAANGRPFAAAQRDTLGAVAEFVGKLDERRVLAAKNYRFTENTTAFDVHADGPGVVVLTETFWPGDFRAEVNGQKAAILRLNHAFKGVALTSAGDYRIVFRYVPKNFPRNLGLACGGLILGVVSIAFGLRRTRIPEPLPPSPVLV